MAEKTKCYWTKDSYCGVELHEKDDEIFIIGSCNSTRREYIDKIIDTVKNKFKMKAVFAEDLSQHNGYKAFCSNICSPLISSTLVIVDLSAVLTNIYCSSCSQDIEHLQQSINVYWEYGYACGLGKRVLLLIDETQIEKLPFDVADTQVERYNLDNLGEKLIKLIKLKLSEPLISNRYNFLPPPLPPTPIGPNDHRIQPLIELVKYKAVGYYRETKLGKKQEFFKLIDLLCSFKQSFQKYHSGGGVLLFIEDYLGISRDDLQSRLDSGDKIVDIPRKSPLIIAGDFCLKAQKYILKHPEFERILIKNLHGEFDTEIRAHTIFPQNMRFDTEFLLALEELKKSGFIRGEKYLNQNCETEFIIPSQVHITSFIEKYSLDYYFQQHFTLLNS